MTKAANNTSIESSILSAIALIGQKIKQTKGVCEESGRVDSFFLKALTGQIPLVKALKSAEALESVLN